MTKRRPDTFTALAPCRISLAGGGTDIPPYPSIGDGAVVSCTIDVFARTVVRLLEEHNEGIAIECRALSAHHRVLCDAISSLLPSGCGAEVVLNDDMSYGSGLGMSSARTVALVAACAAAAGRALVPAELAEQAYRLERFRLGFAGGRQDHYASAFGGWNFFEFRHNNVTVTPLKLTDELQWQLDRSLLLVALGPRASSSDAIMASQIARYKARDGSTLEILASLSRLAYDLRDRLEANDVGPLGEILHESWLLKRALADGITNPAIDAVYDSARTLGALGGKVLGAGGGGYLLLHVDPSRRDEIARHLQTSGLRLREFRLVGLGARASAVSARRMAVSS
jgi:D-glycero-alpha-D-manno-heptose-7-phosphate kinase